MAQFTAFDQTPLHYETIGGTTPPLVLIPGGPRDSAYLEDLGGLAQHRALLRYDARGTGQSGVPQDTSTYAYPYLAEDVEALRLAVGLDRIDILAHSSGTVVAAAYAAKYPQRLGRLILVGPGSDLYGAGGEDLGDIFGSRQAEPWFPEVAQAAQELMTLGPADPPDRVFDVLSRYTPAGYGGWGQRQQDHATAQLAGFSMTAWSGFWSTDRESASVVADLAAVTTPVLVLTGQLDGLTGVSVGDVVAGVFKDARHVTIAGAGHFPWVDQPERFVAAVRDFLADESA
jgi:pimeloyl-ACP methyl ester carboxylesterase